MTTVQWLYRAWHLDEEIRQLEEEIRTEEAKAVKITQSLDGVPVSSSKDPHARIESSIEALKLIDMLETFKCRRISTVCEIQEVIETVEDASCRMLLRMRFVECKRWKDIIRDMHYSERQIKNLRKKALKLVAPAVEEKIAL